MVKVVPVNTLLCSLDSTVRASCGRETVADSSLGCAMIVARSFARIHETNLKKQGVLPLWFADKSDYSRIGAGDVLETLGVADLLEGKPDAAVTIRLIKPDGETFQISTKHTLSVDQLNWFRAGSALNHIRSQMAN
jgi:homoaconitase